jgi:ribosomal protein S8
MRLVNNMLIALKNASLAEKLEFEVSTSGLVEKVLFILYKEGAIRGFVHVPIGNKVRVLIRPQMFELFRYMDVVTQSSRSSYADLPSVKRLDARTYFGVISTTKGLMTLKRARQCGVGGRVLFTF